MTSFTTSTLNYPSGSPTPIKRVIAQRAPLTTDNKNFIPGDEWLDEPSQDWWKYVTAPAGVALWVRIGGTGAAIESVNVDASTPPGTDPVVGNASNEIIITGGQVAPAAIGANVIRTNSLAANSLIVQIQQTSTAAAKDTTLNGVAHFNSGQFTNDQGFVSLAGGGTAIDSFIPDAGTNPVVPNGAGAVTMVGGNGILTTGGLNQLTFDMESPFTGDFTFQSTTIGDTETLTVTNTSNTANSQAQVLMTVAGVTAGDPFTTYTVTGATSWSHGIDNSVSDTFVISASTTLGTTDVLRSTTDGEITMPLQPAFLARSSAAQNAVTGDGTTYTILFPTEIFDQNNDFASNTFTSPVTGRYPLQASVLFDNFGATNTFGYFSILTSNREYLDPGDNPFVCQRSDGFTGYRVSCFADMDAADTATVTLTVGPIGKTVNLFTGDPAYTFFSGNLEC